MVEAARQQSMAARRWVALRAQPASTSRGAATMRDRWTAADLGQLDRQIVEVLAADHPQSVRHTFYVQTDPRLPVAVDKSEAGYRRVQRRLHALRESGAVPFDWIVDATRRGFHTATYRSGADFLRRVAGLYRADVWRGAATHCEIWCESRSIAGVLEADCRETATSLFPTAGFASDSLIFEAARDHVRHQGSTSRGVVLYCGDHDPSGLEIDRDAEAKLRRYIDRLGGDPDWLEFRRLAITPAQIVAYGLPTKPRKASERRRPEVTATVEAEAMPAGDLRRIVRSAVEAYLPAGALHAAQVAEASERAGLLRLAGFTVQAP